MSFGKRLKEKREELGITQVQLADMLGVTKGAIGNYETGANSPKATILYKVFDVLKCDANYLFQDEMGLNYPMKVSYDEMEHIKKYRGLDTHGKQLVDMVLDKELGRSKEPEAKGLPQAFPPDVLGEAKETVDKIINEAIATEFPDDVEGSKDETDKIS